MFYKVLYCCLKPFINVNLFQTPNFQINFRLTEPFLRTLLTDADADTDTDDKIAPTFFQLVPYLSGYGCADTVTET